MYNIRLLNVEKVHRYEELIKLFLKADEFFIISDKKDVNSSRSISVQDVSDSLSFSFSHTFNGDVNDMSRAIFEFLKEKTKIEPPWGIMTGIRPVRLFRNYVNRCKKLYGHDDIKSSVDSACEMIKRDYLVTDAKIQLLREIYEHQEKVFDESGKRDVGIYIGIPFCPTRCSYCSFTSNQGSDEEIEAYLRALEEEIAFVAAEMKRASWRVESIYVGGGTPTTLSENQLKRLICFIKANIDMGSVREFTVEAGRPDTITLEKLQILNEMGVDRISINPQSMKDETLVKIGRKHSVESIREAFAYARQADIKIVNCDLIAGLEDETVEDFKNSIDEILELKPQNITVHTLAMKRASRLTQEREIAEHNAHADTQIMMSYAYAKLQENGYKPYYMYRQKNMLGLGENVGFSLDGADSLYNFRIMEECQSIIAMGAGAISKIYFPREDRIERAANVSNFKEYISRIDEMKKRKENIIFKEAKNVD